jgi:myo-inositol 2-dehydrogenase/D-chiro-inositol 1-dehydrogenase
MGRFHAETLAWRVPSAELVRLVDVDANRARSISEQLDEVPWSSSYEDMLQDPYIQAVIIVTPTPLHADMIEAAARSGKHVFCEKPVSLDASRTLEATDTARISGMKLQVGFHRRFDPDYQAARRTIAAGDLGQLFLFRTSSRDPRPPSFDFLEQSGGLFVDFSLHDLDLARWLVGEVEEVTAVGTALSDARFGRLGDLDNAAIVLRFVGGALGLIDNSRVSGYGYECSSEVMGSLATLRVDGQRQVGPEILTDGRSVHRFGSEDVERWAVAYTEELAGFVRAVIEDLEPIVGGNDDAAAVVLAQAAACSLRERRTVRITERFPGQ